VTNRTLFEDSDAVVALKSLLAMPFVRARHTQLMWGPSITDSGRDGYLASIFAMATDRLFERL
jgi:hypothetical protein